MAHRVIASVISVGVIGYGYYKINKPTLKMKYYPQSNRQKNTENNRLDLEWSKQDMAPKAYDDKDYTIKLPVKTRYLSYDSYHGSTNTKHYRSFNEFGSDESLLSDM